MSTSSALVSIPRFFASKRIILSSIRLAEQTLINPVPVGECHTVPGEPHIVCIGDNLTVHRCKDPVNDQGKRGCNLNRKIGDGKRTAEKRS